jgi:hypothetical protein
MIKYTTRFKTIATVKAALISILMTLAITPLTTMNTMTAFAHESEDALDDFLALRIRSEIDKQVEDQLGVNREQIDFLIENNDNLKNVMDGTIDDVIDDVKNGSKLGDIIENGKLDDIENNGDLQASKINNIINAIDESLAKIKQIVTDALDRIKYAAINAIADLSS